MLPISDGALPRPSFGFTGVTGVVLVGDVAAGAEGAGAGVPAGTAVLGGVAVESLGVFEGDVEGPDVLVWLLANAPPLAQRAAMATAEVSLRMFIIKPPNGFEYIELSRD